MHPFGGTPICPRCSKPVYLAEQAMGPGRRLYHKPCLACTLCNKRLDSFNLVEHNQQPYCKSCHLKSFGTRDLRHANLPYAPPPGDNTARSSSPVSSSSPNKSAFPPQALLRPLSTGNSGPSSSPAFPMPRLRPNRSLVTSPISPLFPRGPASPTRETPANGTSPDTNEPSNGNLIAEEETEEETEKSEVPEQDEEAEESRDTFSEPSDNNTSLSTYPSNTGRPGIGTIPRTIPLYLNSGRHRTSRSVGVMPSRSESPTASSALRANKEAEDVEGASKAERDDHFAPQSFPRSGTPGGTPLGRNHSTGPSSFGGSPGTFSGMTPLKQTATGTRYGIALSGGGSVGVHMTGSEASPRKWGGGTPICPRCTKSVFFAEQVKAVGKTYHKGCLRCMECNSSLDSNKLRDHDGDPFCVRCYNKLYGPQGGGYALLGKAGG
ncbi:hypothetical protein M413DRAFT_444945 [Hebeloma cylindrosporum]|uniref:LIM zinc-binding domain-containing protein n=1 Tax=Hebeloma cylindrosporum TaxID=76867 RepID=A0A0C3CBU4_HEBCY|nr:hypothetical protein M413DRAFT_444945 [Hebeloma cylindrosporum h7]